MTERDADHAEILGLARLMADDEDRPSYAASSLSASGVTSDSFGVAREMFLNIFVSGALDHASGLLEQDKEAIARTAAGVDALKAGIARVKAALGMPPTPGAQAADPRYPPQDPPSSGPAGSSRLPW